MDGGDDRDASLRGRAKHRGDERVLVGDRVRLVLDGDDTTIEEVLPRRSILKRRSPGQGRGTRQVAANLDQVIVVGAAVDPVWDPAMMDRFLAVAEANQLSIHLIINKIDLDHGWQTLAVPYVAAGYKVLGTSAATGTGIAELRELLSGQVSLFTGPTGVGKSSLGNAIQPGLALRTGVVSRRSRGGQHTTVTAEMYPLLGGGFLVDTPGLRDIGLWGLTSAEVGAAFPEIAELAQGCRFDDCRHDSEPKCAVRAAVDDGTLAASRYASFQRLLSESLEAGRWWE